MFSSLSPTFAKSGYTFSGWNTNANGSGTSYADGASYLFASSLTLYAQWTQNVVSSPPASSPPASSITVSFNSGGATGIASPVSVNSGSSVQLPASGVLTNPGFTQTGWYTAATGGTLVGVSGASVVLTSSLTLYAQWAPSALASVIFSANGGKGSVAPVSVSSGSSLTLPTGSNLLNVGYTFAGWSTTSSSQATIYAGGAKITVSAPETFYAVWTHTVKIPATAVLAGAIGPFLVGSSVLTATMKTQIHNIAEGMKSRNFATASMFGYSLANESGANLKTLSARRASSVENYLRDALVALHVQPVAMHATGEGSVANSNNSAFRRVEIFLAI